MKKLTVLSFALLLMSALVVWSSKEIQADPSFSNSSISGSYVFHFSGSGGHSVVQLPLVAGVEGPNNTILFQETSFPLPTPFAGIGEILADGAGHITASGTIVNQELNFGPPLAGPVPSFVVVDHSCDMTFTGSYSVGSDGVGTMSLIPSGPCDLSGGQPINFKLRLAGKGNEGVFLSVTPATPPQDRFSTIMSGSFAKK